MTGPAQWSPESVMVGIPFRCSPVSTSRFDPQFPGPSLALLVPLLSAFCRCGQPLDSRGHHRAACATSGVLGRRGLPLESRAHLQRGWSEGVHQHQGPGPQLPARRPVTVASKWLQTVCLSSTVPSWRLTRFWSVLSEPMEPTETVCLPRRGCSRPGTPHQGTQIPRVDGRVQSRALGCPCLQDWVSFPLSLKKKKRKKKKDSRNLRLF